MKTGEGTDRNTVVVIVLPFSVDIRTKAENFIFIQNSNITL